jgi:glutathione S-transferase
MGYKLVYFPVRGRAQATRYMCLDNGIALEEQVVQGTDWPAMKPTVVFGQLPVLFDGTFEVAQSNAILRHIARKHSLYGKDDIEATLIDMINDSQEDARLSYLRLIYQQYDTEKENYIKSLPEKLALFEKVLGKNNGGSGFFVGAKASFLDYTMFDLLDNLSLLSAGCLDAFPLLKAYHTRMAARPKLAEYRNSDAFKKLPVNGNGKQ